ncbi:MAG: protein-disulfide isomerase [Candidatus Nanopelagicaceae bacterium]|nr:protein-disulfide isomerase [Candidatus Nanopelagicaceae bacterium]
MATAKKKDNVTRNLVIGMVVLVVAVTVGVSLSSNKAKESAAVPSSVDKAEGYGIVFNKGLADVPKIDIWEDFQCPVCRDFEVVNNKQIREWIEAKKVTAVFHPLSFIGAESAYMANAAACSADEGKFLQYHEALYANQAEAENSGKWNAATLIALGANLKITSKSFTDCVKNGKYQDWVTNVANDGASKNVDSTPTVFINGKEMERLQKNYFDAGTFEKLVFKK